jgi:hypothetical protein
VTVTDTNDPVPGLPHGAGADADRGDGTSHRCSDTRTSANLVTQQYDRAHSPAGPSASNERRSGAPRSLDETGTSTRRYVMNDARRAVTAIRRPTIEVVLCAVLAAAGSSDQVAGT